MTSETEWTQHRMEQLSDLQTLISLASSIDEGNVIYKIQRCNELAARLKNWRYDFIGFLHTVAADSRIRAAEERARTK